MSYVIGELAGQGGPDGTAIVAAREAHSLPALERAKESEPTSSGNSRESAMKEIVGATGKRSCNRD